MNDSYLKQRNTASYMIFFYTMIIINHLQGLLIKFRINRAF